ncbi:MAG: carbohydrate kinase family protein [Anaerolineales bacterium]|nr:carbohydrate kinase family protein [Anaerolineales bacterium]
MTQPYAIISMGDTNLDYVVGNSLPFKFSGLVENGIIWWDEINEIPGGSGLNFCVFAQKEGYRPLLLSKVGRDTAGHFITDWLNTNNISMPQNWTADSPTGKAIIMRDNADIRLLINNKQNANQLLSLDDIEEHKTDITSCQVLYISGYCISDITTPRFQATLRAMEYAKQANTPNSPVIVFDVVPHRIYEKMTFDEFLSYTKNVDILISEVATMRRFLGLGSKSETIDYQMAEETLTKTATYYDRIILRFGPTGCDEQVLWDKHTNSHTYNETGHKSTTDKRGFGDILTIRSLRDFFHVLP